ncbi:uncharacterized protein DS421_14g464740 [Arachis hypogaea]|nr:uncharacterized protein DS421_14g464740 [Arachis hypogaea]
MKRNHASRGEEEATAIVHAVTVTLSVPPTSLLPSEAANIAVTGAKSERERASSGEREGAVVQREAAATVACSVTTVDYGLPSLAAVPSCQKTALSLLESTVGKGFIFNLCSSEFLEHCCHYRAFTVASSEPGAVVVT